MQEKKIRCLVCHVPLSLHHSLLSEMTITSLMPSNEISASHLSGSSLLLSIESNDDSVSGTETDHTIIDKKYTEKNECASTSSASAYINDKHVERPTLIFDDLEVSLKFLTYQFSSNSNADIFSLDPRWYYLIIGSR